MIIYDIELVTTNYRVEHVTQAATIGLTEIRISGINASGTSEADASSFGGFPVSFFIMLELFGEIRRTAS